MAFSLPFYETGSPAFIEEFQSYTLFVSSPTCRCKLYSYSKKRCPVRYNKQITNASNGAENMSIGTKYNGIMLFD